IGLLHMEIVQERIVFEFSLELITTVFFFQAEDGIRDYKVTGVQTCALPISNWSPPRIENGLLIVSRFSARLQGRLHWPRGSKRRSEERRVGKECRYRWSQEH